MFGGVLSKLLSSNADDVARAVGKTATSKLDDILPAVSKKTASKTASSAATKATSKNLDDLVSKAGNYLKRSGDNANTVSRLKDKLGLEFAEGDVPVDKLVRIKDYQPRTTASGAGTTKSVFEKGYQEGMVDQPIVVRKVGDQYQVLGGHSRTLGLEQRAKAGLDNPKSIKARIYEGITDDEAKQISRGANQGGQYESTLDMAKSIAESKRAGLEPMVKRNNIKKGTDFDDYNYAWDAIEKNQKMQDIINENLDFSPDTLIATARNARKRGMDSQQFMNVVEGLYNGEKLSKKNVDNVVNLLTGKIKSLNIKNAQGSLFGDDVGRAIDSVDLLSDFDKVTKDLNSQMNAIKKVQGMDMPDEAMSALDSKASELQDRLKNIQDEILNRWNGKYSDKPATASTSSSTSSSSKASNVPEFGSLPPQIDQEQLDNAIVPSDDQMGLFGMLDSQPAPTTPSTQTTKATASTAKSEGKTRAKSAKKKAVEQEPTQPTKIEPMYIQAYWDNFPIEVKNKSTKKATAEAVNKYLPNITDSDIEEIPVRVLKGRDKGKSIKVNGDSQTVEIPVENRSRNRQSLDMQAAIDSLPSKDDVKKMSDDELLQFARSWRQSPAYALIARAMANNYNQNKSRSDDGDE